MTDREFAYVRCTGTAKNPHRRASVAVFRAYEPDSWEEVALGTADYDAAWEDASKDPTMASFDALTDHPGHPKERVTQSRLVGSVPVPEDMPDMDALAWWEKQDIRTRYEFRCPANGCRLTVRVTDDRLFPILNDTPGPVAYIDLAALAAILSSNRS